MADEISAVHPQDTEETLGPCVVCDEDLDPTHHTSCERCLRPFHMRMTENVEAKDCGNVWFDEQTCATIFVCNPCYAHIVGAT